MNPLISAVELADIFHDPDLVVVDCRHQLADPSWGRRAYQTAHLPGATFLHLDEDLSGPLSGKNGRHPLPDPEVLAQKLGDLGIHNGSRVVAYDDPAASVPGAARLWWLLEWMGHAKIQVLDGGYSGWVAHGHSVDASESVRGASTFAVDLQPHLIADAEEIYENICNPQFLLVDARSAERFKGIGETLDPVGGHIPQAANRFFQHNLNNGLFKPAETLRNEWTTILGSWPVDQVVHQCGSGVTACHNLLALASAGMKGGRLYAGSWSEWCADPARPVSCD